MACSHETCNSQQGVVTFEHVVWNSLSVLSLQVQSRGFWVHDEQRSRLSKVGAPHFS